MRRSALKCGGTSGKDKGEAIASIQVEGEVGRCGQGGWGGALPTVPRLLGDAGGTSVRCCVGCVLTHDTNSAVSVRAGGGFFFTAIDQFN